jgi:hypothetical protein
MNYRYFYKLRRIWFSIPTLLLVMATAVSVLAQEQRWSIEKANDWYAQKPWPVGANYVPGDAINELEIWQAANFDPGETDGRRASA